MGAVKITRASPGHRHLIAPQDQIYVLATRAGVSSVLARSQPA